jgi:nucleotide-binding universal stress UspA family protein
MFVDSKLYSTRDVMQDAGRQVLEHAKSTILTIDRHLDVRVKFDLVNGPSPVDHAVKYAKENDVDLIVVGCHGHHASRREYLGTVAARLLNAAPCSVLVVR